MEKQIHVAGDVCLDILGISIPPKPGGGTADNWRQTGEIRTHYRGGGAFLLAEFIQAAVQGKVQGPCLELPVELLAPGQKGKVLSVSELEAKAARLTRQEIVHSLLRLDRFRAMPGDKDCNAIRVRTAEGFTGPSDENTEPSLIVHPPDSGETLPDIVVLDDTGNRFRRTHRQWPKVVDSKKDKGPLIVHKLHRPLPDFCKPNPLWGTLEKNCASRRIVLVSVDDLREADVVISCGLSWERTALELVWQLLNAPQLKILSECSHLVLRLGLDAAVYWRHDKDAGKKSHQAWLIYNPSGIEGTTENSREGTMAAYGSAFTAALVKNLATGTTADVLALRGHPNEQQYPSKAIEHGIREGLLAAQRLLQFGFEVDEKHFVVKYPTNSLFQGATDKESRFYCQPIPVIPGATTPDRGYWRLLDQIFANRTQLLHRAVALTATNNQKPADQVDKDAKELLDAVPIAVFAKALRTYDRREIENYRALYSLMYDYVRQLSPLRPLSVAVFGPPGAGKSFGVKKVAEALAEAGALRKIEPLTFNLSQYRDSEELAAAFHEVRDVVLKGKIPLVFFDEFDTALDGRPLGWLRYFLSPMQDGEFLDRGTPHPIGQSIFVFAGGTSDTCEEFSKPFTNRAKAPNAFEEFKEVKGPDFLSRLRGSLNIPGLELNPDFDAYGPTEAFPSEAAILLRRAGIFAFQVGEKAPFFKQTDNALKVSEPVIRALLHLPQFKHGNRSFEALLDMSHLVGERKFNPSLLPASVHTDLHASSGQLIQLLATEYPFPQDDRRAIAKEIHEHYLEQRKAKGEYKPTKPSHQNWGKLEQRFVASNEQQADDIARKLRRIGLWFRKIAPAPTAKPPAMELTEDQVQLLAREEHDRWVASQRSLGYIHGLGDDQEPFTHPCIMKWDDPKFPQSEKDKDLDAIRAIPRYLKAAGYVITDSSQANQ